MLLLLLTLPDDARIKSQTRIVKKHSTVDFAHINLRLASFQTDSRRALKVERDVQIFGEVIECAEREYAERAVCVKQDGSDGVDRSIATSGNNRLAVLFNGALRQCDYFRAALGQRDARLDACGCEKV